MTRRLILLELGIVVLDNDNLIKVDVFKDPVNDFIKVLNKEYDLSILIEYIKDYNVSTNYPELRDKLKEYGIVADLMKREEIINVTIQKIDLLLRSSIVKSKEEAISKLREFAINLSELKIREISGRRDLHIIQAINCLDDYDKIINIMSERIREWYSLHFPELVTVVTDINRYLDIILIGKRNDLNIEELKKLGFEKVDKILSLARESKGGDITNDDINILKKLAGDLKMLLKTRESIVRYLDKEMESIAPNIKELVGANIGARLIAKAGGLDKLSSLPASTIQVLGAEKALFRALKKKSKPPKHGILFQHALVHSSPPWQRGKIARALATNLALAARIDFYKGVRDPELVKRLNARIEEIKSKYKEPPKRIDKVKDSSKHKKKNGRKR